jgi:hypothetical protein
VVLIAVAALPADFCLGQTKEMNSKVKMDAKEAMELEKEAASKIYDNMLDNADSSFHSKYNKGGYATSYECPN